MTDEREQAYLDTYKLEARCNDCGWKGFIRGAVVTGWNEDFNCPVIVFGSSADYCPQCESSDYWTSDVLVVIQ